MDLLNFFFHLHQIMYSFGKQREKIWGEGHFNSFKFNNVRVRFEGTDESKKLMMIVCSQSIAGVTFL